MHIRICCAAIVLAFGVGAVDAQTEQTPYFEYSDCPFELPDGEVFGETIDCGYLTVPELAAIPTAPTIDLAVAILYSFSENPVSDPVVYLEGGPGGSALDGIDSWLNSSILDTRDLILIDQRGTGYSEPSLNCYEIDEADEYANSLELTRACKNRLVGEGVNLSAYNSADSAADLADLRRVLEIDQWNVLGISYGTRLALTYMRDYPQGIRSVILDSVYPPQVAGWLESGPNTISAFAVLFNGCAADPQCSAAYPNLNSVFYETVDTLNQNPVTYPATDPDTGEAYDGYLDGATFVNTIFEAQYDAFSIPYLPLVIYSVAEGDYAPFDDLSAGALYASPFKANKGKKPYFVQEETEDAWTEDVGDSEGMFNSVECREEIPFNDLSAGIGLLQAAPPEIRGILIADLQDMYDTCAIWDVEPADPIETLPVQSDLPTLVLAGEYDPVTPPTWSAKTAEHLPNSYYFVFPGIGHSVTDSVRVRLDRSRVSG